MKVIEAFLRYEWLRIRRVFPKDTSMAADKRAGPELQGESKGLAFGVPEAVESKGMRGLSQENPRILNCSEPGGDVSCTGCRLARPSATVTGERKADL